MYSSMLSQSLTKYNVKKLKEAISLHKLKSGTEKMIESKWMPNCMEVKTSL